jgi:fatty acid desaturase
LTPSGEGGTIHPRMGEAIVPRGEEFRVRARERGLPMEKVRQLSELDPWRATASLLSTWGLIAASVAASISWHHPAVIAASVLMIAACQHGLAILAHQSAHYRMYQARWLNDLVGELCALPLAVSVITYRIVHRIHHNHLYSEIDPDLAQMAGYPRGKLYLVRKLLKDLVGLTVVKNYLYFFGKPQPPKGSEKKDGPVDDTSPALKAAARRDLQLVVAFQIAQLAVFVVTGAWRWYLLLWVLPLVTVLQVLLRLRAVCEHGAVTDTSHPLRAARTNLAPWLVQFFLFPHQMNYHIEHHLYPSVPHYRLAECHAAMQAEGLLEGAEVAPTFRACLKKIFADPVGREPSRG